MITFRQPFTGTYPITLDFGEEWLPTYKKGEHTGIDYGCPEGTPILASADGTVKIIANLYIGYGKYIILNHGNYSTLYAHLSRIDVDYGQTVKQGDVIGLSGSTGKSSGPHLHFELRDCGTPIDPKTKLRSVFDATSDDISSDVTPVSHPVVESSGFVQIVCDLANVRCHCDMSHIVRQLPKGTKIKLEASRKMYNGLPYRMFFDEMTGCHLYIAEYDSFGTQILMNAD